MNRAILRLVLLIVFVQLAGHDTCPTIADWNKDGKPDLLIGAEDGHFYYIATNLPHPGSK